MLADETSLSVCTKASHFPSLLQAGSTYETAADSSCSSGTGSIPRANAWSTFLWSQISPVLSLPKTELSVTKANHRSRLGLADVPAPAACVGLKVGENFPLIRGSPFVLNSKEPGRPANLFIGARETRSTKLREPDTIRRYQFI